MKNINQKHNLVSNNTLATTGKWKKLTRAISLAAALAMADVTHADQDTSIEVSTQPAIAFVQPFSFSDDIRLDGKNIPANTNIQSIQYLETNDGIKGDMSRALAIVQENPTKKDKVIEFIRETIDASKFNGKILFVSSMDEKMMRHIFPNVQIKVSSQVDQHGMFIIAREASLVTRLVNEWEILLLGGALGVGTAMSLRRGRRKEKEPEVLPSMTGAVPTPPVNEVPDVKVKEPSFWQKWGEKRKNKSKSEEEIETLEVRADEIKTEEEKSDDNHTQPDVQGDEDTPKEPGIIEKVWHKAQEKIRLWKYNRELIKNVEGKELLGAKIRIEKIEFFDEENGQSSVSITFNDTVDLFRNTEQTKTISSHAYKYSDEMQRLDQEYLADPTKGKLVKIFIKSIVLNGKVLIFSVTPYDENIIIEEYSESDNTKEGEAIDEIKNEGEVDRAYQEVYGEKEDSSGMSALVNEWLLDAISELPPIESAIVDLTETTHDAAEQTPEGDNLAFLAETSPEPVTADLREIEPDTIECSLSREDIIIMEGKEYLEGTNIDIESIQVTRNPSEDNHLCYAYTIQTTFANEVHLKEGSSKTNDTSLRIYKDPSKQNSEVVIASVYLDSNKNGTPDIWIKYNPMDNTLSIERRKSGKQADAVVDNPTSEEPVASPEQVDEVVASSGDVIAIDPLEKTFTAEEIQTIEGIELLDGLTGIESIQVLKDTHHQNLYNATILFTDGGKIKQSLGYNFNERCLGYFKKGNNNLRIFFLYDIKTNKFTVRTQEVIKIFTAEEIQEIEGIELLDGVTGIEKIEKLTEGTVENHNIRITYQDGKTEEKSFYSKSTDQDSWETITKEDGSKVYLRYIPAEDRFIVESQKVIKTFTAEEIQAIEGIELLDGITGIEKIEKLTERHMSYHNIRITHTDGKTKEKFFYSGGTAQEPYETLTKEDGSKVYLRYIPAEDRFIVESQKVIKTFTAEEIQEIDGIDLLDGVNDIEKIEKLTGEREGTRNFRITYKNGKVKEYQVFPSLYVKEFLETFLKENEPDIRLSYIGETDEFVIEREEEN